MRAVTVGTDNMSKKTIFIILGGVAILTGISILALLWGARNTNTVTVDRTVEEQIQDQSKDLTRLILTDEGAIYFNTANKKFFRIQDGKQEELYDPGFEPLAIKYSTDRKRVLLIGSMDDLGKPIELVNLESKEKVTLAYQVWDAEFSPASNSLVLYYVDHEKAEAGLYLSDLGFKQKRKLVSLDYGPDRSYLIRWPTQETIWIMPVTAHVEPVTIQKVSFKDGGAVGVSTQRFGDFIVSPDGKTVASTIMSEREAELVPLYQNLFILKDEKTWTDTRITTTLTQAVWGEQGILYVIGDKGNDKNKLYRIDTNTGSSELVAADIPADLAVTDMVYRAGEKKIYLINDGQAIIIDLSKEKETEENTTDDLRS